LFLAEIAARERQHNAHDFRLRRRDVPSVKAQERIRALKCNALVSINEWMILGDSKGICGREPMHVRSWVKLMLPPGASQSGVE
jgi:hypothetical protein